MNRGISALGIFFAADRVNVYNLLYVYVCFCCQKYGSLGSRINILYPRAIVDFFIIADFTF